MSLAGKFNDHPATVGENYGQHFVCAMGFSMTLLRAALCCAIHAVLPFLCEKAASESIVKLHDRMVTNRSRLQAADETGATHARPSA